MAGDSVAGRRNYCKCTENNRFFRHVKSFRGVRHSHKVCVLVGLFLGIIWILVENPESLGEILILRIWSNNKKLKSLSIYQKFVSNGKVGAKWPSIDPDKSSDKLLWAENKKNQDFNSIYLPFPGLENRSLNFETFPDSMTRFLKTSISANPGLNRLTQD